jgi:uncharacterized protein DUF1524
MALLAASLIGSVLIVPHFAFAATISARALALKLVTKAENGTGYYRTFFSHWIDADRDGCDTREEVLMTESRVKPTLGTGCKVMKGKWKSWYDGVTWTNPSDVDIDHVVALKEAWDSGARSWTKTARTSYANDLAYPLALDAVTDNVNQDKSDRDPAQWLPPLKATHCVYAKHWVAIKYRWRLSVDPKERVRLLSILSGACGAQTLTIPARAF